MDTGGLVICIFSVCMQFLRSIRIELSIASFFEFQSLKLSRHNVSLTKRVFETNPKNIPSPSGQPMPAGYAPKIQLTLPLPLSLRLPNLGGPSLEKESLLSKCIVLCGGADGSDAIYHPNGIHRF